MAISLVARGLIDLKPLVTHRYKFEEAVKAFGVTQAGKDEDGKVSIRPPVNKWLGRELSWLIHDLVLDSRLSSVSSMDPNEQSDDRVKGKRKKVIGGRGESLLYS
jgi:hypothetical protein